MSNFDKFDRQKNRQKKKLVEDDQQSGRKNPKYLLDDIYDDEDELDEDYLPYCSEDEEFEDEEY